VKSPFPFQYSPPSPKQKSTAPAHIATITYHYDPINPTTKTQTINHTYTTPTEAYQSPITTTNHPQFNTPNNPRIYLRRRASSLAQSKQRIVRGSGAPDFPGAEVIEAGSIGTTTVRTIRPGDVQEGVVVQVNAIYTEAVTGNALFPSYKVHVNATVADYQGRDFVTYAENLFCVFSADASSFAYIQSSVVDQGVVYTLIDASVRNKIDQQITLRSRFLPDPSGALNHSRPFQPAPRTLSPSQLNGMSRWNDCLTCP